MVQVRLPRATAWFVWAKRYGWTERVYLAEEGDDPAWYTEGAFYWAQARARLLAPNITVARLVVSLRDTYRDALVVEPPATPASAGRRTYDPDLAGAGSPEPAMVRVVERKWTADGLYSFHHYLNGWPRESRQGDDKFTPPPAWQRAYDFYRKQLLGDPADERYPVGRFGMKVAAQGPGAPPRVGVESAAWEGGTLTVTAPGSNVRTGDWVRLSGLEGDWKVPNGLYLAVATSPDTFNVPLPVGPFTYQKGGWIRRIVYKYVPYHGLALGQVTALRVRTKYVPWTWVNLGPVPVPINPCGMVMGWGRGPPPRVKMRFFRDSDLENDVQWQVAQDGAEDFPLYHSFAPSLYMDRPSGPWARIGEVEGTRLRSNVWHFSQLPGKCYTGDPDQWADGCYTADVVGPVPACCQPPVTLPAPPIGVGISFLFGTPAVTLTVDQYTGLPSVAEVVQLDFDDASGLFVQVRGPGDAGVTLAGATETHAGGVSTGAQRWAGPKTFTGTPTVEAAFPTIAFDVGPSTHYAELGLVESPVNPGGAAQAVALQMIDRAPAAGLVVDPDNVGLLLTQRYSDCGYAIRDPFGQVWRGWTGTISGVQFLCGIAVQPAPTSSGIVGAGGVGLAGGAALGPASGQGLTGAAGAGVAAAGALGRGTAAGGGITGAAAAGLGGASTLGGGVGAATVFKDTFTAADNTGLAYRTPDVGPAWGGSSGYWLIQGGQATQMSADGAYHPITAPVGHADVTAVVTVTPPASGSYAAGLTVRWTDDSNYLVVDVAGDGGGTVRVSQVSAGTLTVLSSAAGIGANTPVTLRVVCSGTTVNVFVGGVEKSSGTVAFNATATSHGLWNSVASGWGQAFFDDYSITTP